MKNKGLNTDQSKTKLEAGKPGEKDEKSGAKDNLKSPSTESAHSDPKSPIASSVQTSETVVKSETTQPEAKPDEEKLKEPLIESFPLKKEGKEKTNSPSKKPRPPPLFIPRPLAQGKGTPLSASKLPAMFNSAASWHGFCSEARSCFFRECLSSLHYN